MGRAISNIKLGVFVMGGLLFLILLLYMIGKNENLFGSNFRLRVRFENVQGLTPGNNVRYAGIQAGTVKKVIILNDTLIEVLMLIETRMKPFIRKNAVVSIGTDGLMGNRVLNISPVKTAAELVEEDDILASKKGIEMDDMLETLANTNSDVAVIAAELKKTIHRINSGNALWSILEDENLPAHLRASMMNVRRATAKAEQSINAIHGIVEDIKEGKGSLGTILADTAMAVNLNQAILKINKVGEDADTLAHTLHTIAGMIQQDLDNGKGTANLLLKDTALASNLKSSLDHIREGTEGFNEIMEALKHNFLLRGYFRKLEKQKEKEAKKSSL